MIPGAPLHRPAPVVSQSLDDHAGAVALLGDLPASPHLLRGPTRGFGFLPSVVERVVVREDLEEIWRLSGEIFLEPDR